MSSRRSLRRPAPRPRGGPHRGAAAAPAAETSSVELLTVAWALSTLSTLICQGTAAILLWWLARNGPSLRGEALLNILLLAAVVMGLAGGALLPAVMVLRETPPATPVAACAAVVCLVPVLLIVGRLVWP